LTRTCRDARIAIIHELFEDMGGGEKLVLEAAATLGERCGNVKLYTARLDRETAERLLGARLGRVRVVEIGEPITARLASLAARGHGIRLRRLLILHHIVDTLMDEIRESNDIVLETQANLPTSVDLSYIHYPAVIDTYSSHSPIRAVYNTLVRMLHGKLLGRPGLAATNSRWTAELVEKVYGLRPIILHPPVDVEYFAKASNSADREDRLVLTLSRFTPEKRLHRIVELAAAAREYRFVMIGSATTKEARRYLEKLRRLAKRLGATNVEFRPNLPRNELLALMSRARFYLHPPFPEHFGIAVAEAAAAGLIPIVYRDGGAWTDIASKISPHLGYRELSEALETLRRLTRSPELLDKLSGKAMKVAKEFSRERFQDSLVGLISRLLENDANGKPAQHRP